MYFMGFVNDMLNLWFVYCTYHLSLSLLSFDVHRFHQHSSVHLFGLWNKKVYEPNMVFMDLKIRTRKFVRSPNDPNFAVSLCSWFIFFQKSICLLLCEDDSETDLNHNCTVYFEKVSVSFFQFSVTQYLLLFSSTIVWLLPTVIKSTVPYILLYVPT